MLSRSSGPCFTRPQNCDSCSRAPLQHFLELEALFEDHGVCSGDITDSLVLERTVHEQRALVQPLPTALQLVNRQEGVRLLLDFGGTFAFPVHTSEFSLQILDLTHVWSNKGAGIIDFDDLLALAAADYMYIHLHLSPRQRYPRSLPELLTTFEALLVRLPSGVQSRTRRIRDAATAGL